MSMDIDGKPKNPIKYEEIVPGALVMMAPTVMGLIVSTNWLEHDSFTRDKWHLRVGVILFGPHADKVRQKGHLISEYGANVMHTLFELVELP